MNNIYNQKQAARGLYKIAVVDSKTKEVVWEQKDWGKNLILNNGLDHVAIAKWANCFLYASVGTGVTPTVVDSVDVAASQIGNTVTATVGTYVFSTNDVGNVIKWDSGEEARITGFSTAQTVTATPSQSVESGPFVVYQTNQTGLTAEVKRTSTYLPGVGYCQTTTNTSTGVVAMRRTFDFSAETEQKSYTEIGTTWSATANTANTTFSRILLPEAITVNSGQQLRFVYELQIALTPFSPAATVASVSGWPVSPSTNTNASQQLETWGLWGPDSSGTSAYLDYHEGSSEDANEPCCQNNIVASPSYSAFATIGTGVNRNVTGAEATLATLSNYIPLSFTLTKTSVFSAAHINRTDLRTIGLGPSSYYGSFPDRLGLVVLFDQNQSKANTQTLTLTFRNTWGRTLD